MGDYLKPIMHSLQGSLRSDIRFSELWYLSKPSQLAYVKDKDIPQKVWKVVQTTGERRCLSSRSASHKSEAASKQPRDPRHSNFVLGCIISIMMAHVTVQAFPTFISPNSTMPERYIHYQCALLLSQKETAWWIVRSWRSEDESLSDVLKAAISIIRDEARSANPGEII